jgi:anti-sigma-K factor RskA
MPEPKRLTDAERADLIAYLDGELTGDARRQVENRLITDPAMRTEADTLKRAWDLLELLPRPEPSTTLATRTLRQVSALGVGAVKKSEPVAGPARRPRNYRTALVIATWAAAALVALGVGYAVTPGPRPITAADIDPGRDPLMVREPTVIENLPLYLAGDNLEYVLALDQSDLFADDAGR